MSKANGKEYVLFWECPNCKKRQPRCDYCLMCGVPRPHGAGACEWSEPANEEEMLLAEKIAADSNAFSDAINSLFCSNCERRIPSDAKFCPACGNQVDSSDALPEASQEGLEGTQKIDVTSLPQHHERTMDDTGWLSAGGRPDEHPAPAIPRHNSVPLAAQPKVDVLLRKTSVPSAWDTALQILSNRTAQLTALGVLVLGLLLFFLWPRQQQALVSDFQYLTYTEISHIRVENGNCWEGECPSGYVVVSSSTEPYYPSGEAVVGKKTEVVQPLQEIQIDSTFKDITIEATACAEHGDEYDCSQTVDGVVHPMKCTEEPPCKDISIPATEEVPIYGTVTPHVEENNIYGTKTPYPRTYIKYTRDVIEYDRIPLEGWKSGLELTYPEYTLNPARREAFTGNKGGEQRIAFTIGGKVQYLTFSYEEWKKLQAYNGKEVPVYTVAGNITGLGNLEK